MLSFLFPEVALDGGFLMRMGIKRADGSNKREARPSGSSPTANLPNGDVIAISPNGEQTEIPSWVSADVRECSGTETGEHQPGLVLLVIDRPEDIPTEFVHALTSPADSRAVVVCGPTDERRWRVQALAAGATGCLSPDTPLDDQRSTILIALNYHAERRQARTIRLQSEQLCFDLTSMIGCTTEELAEVKGTARAIHEALDDLRQRIVRIFV